MNSLKQLKTDNGYSNKDLAVKLGVSENYITQALNKPLSNQMSAAVDLCFENIKLKNENSKLKEAIKTIRGI